MLMNTQVVEKKERERERKESEKYFERVGSILS